MSPEHVFRPPAERRNSQTRSPSRSTIPHRLYLIVMSSVVIGAGTRLLSSYSFPLLNDKYVIQIYTYIILYTTRTVFFFVLSKIFLITYVIFIFFIYYTALFYYLTLFLLFFLSICFYILSILIFLILVHYDFCYLKS